MQSGEVQREKLLILDGRKELGHFRLSPIAITTQIFFVLTKVVQGIHGQMTCAFGVVQKGLEYTNDVVDPLAVVSLLTKLQGQFPGIFNADVLSRCLTEEGDQMDLQDTFVVIVRP